MTVRLIKCLLLLCCGRVEASIFSRLVTGVDGAAEDSTSSLGGAGFLANSTKIPLVGFGVGNLEADLIPTMVAEAIQEEKMTRLIDTAHVSDNEELVAQGILEGIGRIDSPEKVEIHVVTKVWYTHLGYERTKLAMQESLQAVKPVIDNEKVDLHLHVLLHWPRCFETIPWMDCVADEEDLPQHVRDAGPDPNKNPDGAWRESWRVLEDFYLSGEYPIESIGVSNFHVQDLEEMEEFARVPPRLIQLNLWSLVYDAHLVHYCHEHGIQVQVFHALQHTVLQPERAPRAFHHIQKVAVETSAVGDVDVSPAQAVLAWLIQHGISVAPRTGRMARLKENSAAALKAIPAMSDKQVETMAHSVEAYLSGEDLRQDTKVSISVHADTTDMAVYWMGGESGTWLAVVRKGQSFNETTFPGHVYRFYDAQNADNYLEHEIPANIGVHATIHVDLQGRTIQSESSSIFQRQDTELATGMLRWLGGMLYLNK